MYRANGNNYTPRGRGDGSWRSRGDSSRRSRGYHAGTQGFRHAPRWPKREIPTPAWVETRGELLLPLKPLELPDPIPETRITDVEFLASYNWLAGEKPSILVPGEPPAWRPAPTSTPLPVDSGTYYRDINACHHPPYPLEPAFRSLLTLHPTFDPTPINLVACSSTLGNLLRASSKIDRTFRFDVDVVGETVFFIRKEDTPKEIIPDVRGFGHTFAEGNTKWAEEVRGSESHQRVVRYNLAGLDMLVRFESDGFLEDMLDKGEVSAGKEGSAKEDDIDDLTAAMQKSKLSAAETNSDEKQGSTETPSAIKITRAGRLIPQHSVFDLKTRSQRREIDMDEVHRRLYMTQTPNFIGAYHLDGIFSDVRVTDITPDLQKYEDENQDVLWQFVQLVRRIVEMVRGAKDGRWEVCRVGKRLVEIRRRREGEEGRVLPEDLIKLWDRGGSEDGAGSSGEENEGETSTYHNPDWDSDSGPDDFTACSADQCGYCGKCKY